MADDLLVTWDFAKVVSFMADRTACQLSSGDVMSDSLQRRMKNELTDVRGSLVSVKHKDIVPSRLMLEDAFGFLEDPKCRDSALWHFDKASTLAHDVIPVVSELKGKMDATCIATVAALFLHEDDAQQAFELCKKHIETLHACAEVQQVFKSKIRKTLKSKFKGMFTRKKRQQALQTVCMINFTLFRYFCGTGSIKNLKDWPTVAMQGCVKVQPVSQMMSVAEKEVGKVPLKGEMAEVMVSDDKFLCIDSTGKEIRLWDPKEMTAGGTFQRWFPMTSIVYEGFLICITEPLASGQQSSVATIDLADFTQRERLRIPGDVNYLFITITDSSVAIVDDKGNILHLSLSDFSLVKRARVQFPRKTGAENERITLSVTDSAVDSSALYWWDVKTASLFKFSLLDGKKVTEVSSHAKVGLLSDGYLCGVELSNDKHVLALEVRSAEDLHVVFKSEAPLQKSREVATTQFCSVSDGLLAVLYKSRRSYWLTVWEITSGVQLWEKFFGGGKLSAAIVSVTWFSGQDLLVGLSDGTLFKYRVATDLSFGRRSQEGTMVRGATSLYNLATPGSPLALTPAPKSRSMSNLLDSSLSERDF